VGQLKEVSLVVVAVVNKLSEVGNWGYKAPEVGNWGVGNSGGSGVVGTSGGSGVGTRVGSRYWHIGVQTLAHWDLDISTESGLDVATLGFRHQHGI
jgi:hypothetical protein